jgi:hypothetical protein
MKAKSKSKENANRQMSIQRLYWDAIKRGDSNKLASLIEAGADLLEKGPSGSPPLIEAVRRGRTACFHVLLGRPGVDPTAASSPGEDPAAGGSGGWTALSWAIERENKEVVKTLFGLAGLSIEGEGEVLLERLFAEHLRGGGPWTKSVLQAVSAGFERGALGEAAPRVEPENAPARSLRL